MRGDEAVFVKINRVADADTPAQNHVTDADVGRATTGVARSNEMAVGVPNVAAPNGTTST